MKLFKKSNNNNSSLTTKELWRKIGKLEGQIQEDELFALYYCTKKLPNNAIIVEIGSYRGKSTIALGMGAAFNKSKVYSIDPHEHFVGVNGGIFGPEDLKIKLKVLNEYNLGSVVFPICLKSQLVGEVWCSQIDLLWIDGDHSYEGVKSDFEKFSKFVKKDGLVIFHDSELEGVNKCITEVDPSRFSFKEKINSLKIFKKK